MPDILQDFPIKAPPDRVFEAIATPAGLMRWWALSATGVPAEGELLKLSFGPGYEWDARIIRYQPSAAFEVEMTRADRDWTGTRVRIELEPRGPDTWLRFRHTGWPETNDHYRISCHCWALYLRILRRFVEEAETVAYEDRLTV